MQIIWVSKEIWLWKGETSQSKKDKSDELCTGFDLVFLINMFWSLFTIFFICCSKCFQIHIRLGFQSCNVATSFSFLCLLTLILEIRSMYCFWVVGTEDTVQKGKYNWKLRNYRNSLTLNFHWVAKVEKRFHVPQDV